MTGRNESVSREGDSSREIMHEEAIPHALSFPRRTYVHRCGTCGEPGHYTPTCPVRLAKLGRPVPKLRPERRNIRTESLVESAEPVTSAAVVRAKALEVLREKRERLRAELREVERQIEEVDAAVARTLRTLDGSQSRE